MFYLEQTKNAWLKIKTSVGAVQNNIIDLQSTRVARTVCCLTPSTYYFQQLTLRSCLTELDHPSMNEQMLTKTGISRAG